MNDFFNRVKICKGVCAHRVVSNLRNGVFNNVVERILSPVKIEIEIKGIVKRFRNARQCLAVTEVVGVKNRLGINNLSKAEPRSVNNGSVARVLRAEVFIV